jgi:hypothetical protein
MNRSNVLLKVILATIIAVSCINSASNPENETTFLESQNNSETFSESFQKRAIKYFSIKDT